MPPGKTSPRSFLSGNLFFPAPRMISIRSAIPCASGRIWYRDGVYWLGDIGVLESRRGRKLGDLTLRLLLYKAQSHAASEVRLRCPAGTEGFFTRLGFRGCASAPDGTEMTISGDRIDLDTCKGCPKTNCPGRK